MLCFTRLCKCVSRQDLLRYFYCSSVSRKSRPWKRWGSVSWSKPGPSVLLQSIRLASSLKSSLKNRLAQPEPRCALHGLKNWPERRQFSFQLCAQQNAQRAGEFASQRLRGQSALGVVHKQQRVRQFQGQGKGLDFPGLQVERQPS